MDAQQEADMVVGALGGEVGEDANNQARFDDYLDDYLEQLSMTIPTSGSTSPRGSAAPSPLGTPNDSSNPVDALDEAARIIETEAERLVDSDNVVVVPVATEETADPYSLVAAEAQGEAFLGRNLPAHNPNTLNVVVSAGNLKDDPAWANSQLSHDTKAFEELSEVYFRHVVGDTQGLFQGVEVLNKPILQQLCRKYARSIDIDRSTKRLGRKQLRGLMDFAGDYARSVGKEGFCFWMAPKNPEFGKEDSEAKKQFLQLKRLRANQDDKLWYELPFFDISSDTKMLGDKLEPMFRKQKEEREQQKPRAAVSVAVGGTTEGTKVPQGGGPAKFITVNGYVYELASNQPVGQLSPSNSGVDLSGLLEPQHPAHPRCAEMARATSTGDKKRPHPEETTAVAEEHKAPHMMEFSSRPPHERSRPNEE